MKYAFRLLLWPMLFFWVVVSGCPMKPAMLEIEGFDQQLAPGSIMETASGTLIDFEQLIQKLSQARVIYVGERHTETRHHEAQLRIIQALAEEKGDLRVGMEMFDHTYQQKLDQWTAGQLEWAAFLKQVHWYANWRFDDKLYKDILDYIQTQRLKLVGINIPFHLPPKISLGGLDSLSPIERQWLPESIDLTQADHRAYVSKVFESHNFRGRREFDHFYAAQCAWEDGMAQAIATHLGESTMVVVVGNGHIVRKFGIPNRAFERNQAPFSTVYMATPQMTLSRQDADFIWVTEQDKVMMRGMRRR